MPKGSPIIFSIFMVISNKVRQVTFELIWLLYTNKPEFCLNNYAPFNDKFIRESFRCISAKSIAFIQTLKPRLKFYLSNAFISLSKFIDVYKATIPIQIPIISPIIEYITDAIEALLVDSEYENLKKHVPKEELKRITQAGLLELTFVYTWVLFGLPIATFLLVSDCMSNADRTNQSNLSRFH
jgi:hypothetical protein